MALLGVGLRGGSSSHKFTCLLARLHFRPGVFSFTNVRSPKPCIFSFSVFLDVSDIDNVSKDPLRSWGSFRLRHISEVSRMGILSGLRKLGCVFRTGWPWGYIPNFSAVLSLVSRSYVPPTALSLQRSHGIVLLTLVPFWKKRLQHSWRDLFSIESDVLGSLIPDFCPRFPLNKKFYRGCPPFSLTGFLFFRLSSYSIEEERLR